MFSPVSAVLKAAGRVEGIERPKGGRGKRRLFWLRPEQAFALLDAATAINQRFGALLTFLTYCGPRLSEALRLTWDDVDLERGYAFLAHTKNGESQPAHLPPVVVAALANLPKEYDPPIGKRRPYKTIGNYIFDSPRYPW